MKKILFIAVMMLPFIPCHADSLDVKLRLGYNVGGTMPLGLPASIRSIDAFNLTPSLMVGADVSMPLDDRWGLSAGLRLENKGMDAEITVKSYRMEMKKGSSEISGLFTGHVKQEVSQWMLTVPLQVTCRLDGKLTLKAGPYVSLLLSKDFSGIAFDGYIRQGNPTGPRIDIGSTEADRATYDFSDDMRTLQWGVGIGLDWQLSRRLGLSADLDWGLSGLFQSSFTTVEQTLYPIYGTLGVFYQF